ncbi:hypothetical protein B0H17DRAFT_1147699 [Mycena rosella]|uniref:Uncharacterized protein n=1 Tax=Mycena rosella TaxID=1033263 RepID=A0AAD7CHM3_MYCRO|nr:hypothetical protein B0H17DRAFT_1147699 [Mycena rosella]
MPGSSRIKIREWVKFFLSDRGRTGVFWRKVGCSWGKRLKEVQAKISGAHWWFTRDGLDSKNDQMGQTGMKLMSHCSVWSEDPHLESKEEVTVPEVKADAPHTFSSKPAAGQCNWPSAASLVPLTPFDRWVLGLWRQEFMVQGEAGGQGRRGQLRPVAAYNIDVRDRDDVSAI